MNWIKELIKRLFSKNKIKLLEQPKMVKNTWDIRNDFIIDLKKSAEIEQDDGNGYKIIQNIRLKDMV